MSLLTRLTLHSPISNCFDHSVLTAVPSPRHQPKPKAFMLGSFLSSRPKGSPSTAIALSCVFPRHSNTLWRVSEFKQPIGAYSSGRRHAQIKTYACSRDQPERSAIRNAAFIILLQYILCCDGAIANNVVKKSFNVGQRPRGDGQLLICQEVIS